MNYTELHTLDADQLAGVDFTALRWTYLQQDHCDSYTATPRNLSLHHAIVEQNWLKAQILCESLLRTCYLDIEMHQVAAYIARQLQRPDRDRFHHVFSDGLLKSLLSTGDGTDVDRAIVIFALVEEQNLLRLMQLKMAQQKLISYQNRWLDQCTIIGPHQQTATLFFDVTALIEYQRQRVRTAAVDPNGS